MLIKTEVLKAMLAVASKGALNVSYAPITELVEVKLENKVFSLTTTTTINYITVKEENIEGDNFSVCVNCNMLNRLVSKFTEENTELTIINNNLHIVSDGVYDVSAIVANGGLVHIPMYTKEDIDITTLPAHEISREKLLAIKSLHSNSVGTNPNMPIFKSYHLAEKTVTTDTHCVCISELNLGVEQSFLISDTLFDFICSIPDDKITWYYKDGKFLFVGQHAVVYGRETENKDKFPATKCYEFVDNVGEFPGNAVVDKNAFLNILERLALFKMDKELQPMYIQFNKQSLVITLKSQNIVETLPYKQVVQLPETEYSCIVAVETVKRVLESIPEAEFSLRWGNSKMLMYVIAHSWFGTALISKAAK